MESEQLVGPTDNLNVDICMYMVNSGHAKQSLFNMVATYCASNCNTGTATV